MPAIITKTDFEVINPDLFEAPYHSEVTGLAGGGYVIVWTSYSEYGAIYRQNDRVMGRLYDADGHPTGEAFVINQVTHDGLRYPVVTPLQDGGFFVAWEVDQYSRDPASIQGRYYNSDGSAAGDEFSVASDIGLDVSGLDLVTLSNGSIVSSHFVHDGDDYYVDETEINIISTDGSQIEFIADGDPDDDDSAFVYEDIASTAALTNGGFVTFTVGEARVFADDGTPVSDVFQLGNGVGRVVDSNVAPLANGGFAALLLMRILEDTPYQKNWMYTQTFDETGQSVGNPTLIDKSDGEYTPSILGLPDDGFLVFYSGYNRFTDTGRHFTIKRFDSDGEQIGEIVMDSSEMGPLWWDAKVALADDHTIVATWRSRSEPDSYQEDAVQRLFSLVDIAEGSNDAETIEGSSHNDEIHGLGGNDQIFGHGSDDWLFGGNGADLLDGGGQNDELDGGVGNDRLKGRQGDDLLLGGAGNDLLNGGWGNDVLDGGAGNDSLYGYYGQDRFIFSTGQDRVHRFSTDDDQIDLSGESGIVDFTDLQNNHMEQVGLDVVISNGADDTMTLLETNLADLTIDNFIF